MQKLSIILIMILIPNITIYSDANCPEGYRDPVRWDHETGTYYCPHGGTHRMFGSKSCCSG